jgi:hypothetical protein
MGSIGNAISSLFSLHGGNLLTRDRLELTSKFNDILKNYLIDQVDN